MDVVGDQLAFMIIDLDHPPKRLPLTFQSLLGFVAFGNVSDDGSGTPLVGYLEYGDGYLDREFRPVLSQRGEFQDLSDRLSLPCGLKFRKRLNGLFSIAGRSKKAMDFAAHHLVTGGAKHPFGGPDSNNVSCRWRRSYVSHNGSRSQRLLVNERELHGKLALPKQEIVCRDFDIPASSGIYRRKPCRRKSLLMIWSLTLQTLSRSSCR